MVTVMQHLGSLSLCVCVCVRAEERQTDRLMKRETGISERER